LETFPKQITILVIGGMNSIKLYYMHIVYVTMKPLMQLLYDNKLF
jgi:hypothetical protein